MISEDSHLYAEIDHGIARGNGLGSFPGYAQYGVHYGAEQLVCLWSLCEVNSSKVIYITDDGEGEKFAHDAQTSFGDTIPGVYCTDGSKGKTFLLPKARSTRRLSEDHEQWVIFRTQWYDPIGAVHVFFPQVDGATQDILMPGGQEDQHVSCFHFQMFSCSCGKVQMIGAVIVNGADFVALLDANAFSQ